MIWKIFARQPSQRKDAEDYARECYQSGVIALGWSELGDLGAFDSREKLLRALARRWPKKRANTIAQWAGSIWAFRADVKPGDYVVCPDRDSGRHYVGVVRSSRAFYDTSPIGSNCSFAYRRRVKWSRRILKANQIRAIWPAGQFGGRQTVSHIWQGAQSLRKFLKTKPKTSRVRRILPIRPDMEWGTEAEVRALQWLRERGYHPKSVANLNLGWDISCGDERFEVKGRKSSRTGIRLSQNEWAAAKKHKKWYTLLIFTAPTKAALQKATPVQIVDPANTEKWTPRVVYEYVLFESSP